MSTFAQGLPEGWTVTGDEIAPYVVRILAEHADGRRIEMTGTDEERMKADVYASVVDSDQQLAEKRKQTA